MIDEKLSNLTVSVIIPAYNHQEDLDRAIYSVLTQTRLPSEIIVIDDFSDPPIQVPVETKVPIKLFKMQKNGGPYAARNYAIKQAQGNLIAFLDSDDEWLPEKLKYQLDGLYDSKSFFSFTDGFVVKQRHRVKHLRYFSLSTPNSSKKFFGLLEERSSFIANSSVVLSKDIILSRTFFIEDLIGSDFRMWTEILMFEPTVEVRICYNPLFKLNVMSDSVSSNFEKKQRHLLQHLNSIALQCGGMNQKHVDQKSARILLSVMFRLGYKKFQLFRKQYAANIKFQTLIAVIPKFIVQTLHYLFVIKRHLK